MYENGDESFLDILFSSDSMIDFLNNAEYISEISKYDREKLIEYGENKDRITNLLANLETQKSELETQEAKYETELGELEEQKSVLDSKKSEQEVLSQESFPPCPLYINLFWLLTSVLLSCSVKSDLKSSGNLFFHYNLRELEYTFHSF